MEWRRKSASPGSPSKRRRRATVATVIAAALVAPALIWNSSQSAFNNTTNNTGNKYTGGNMILADNDGGSATMFNFTDVKPGDTWTSCITITYTGNLPSTVKLYGTTAGTGLDPYLNLTVTRGTISSGSFGDCTNFTADTTNYGLGAGIVSNGTLTAYPDTAGTGTADPHTATAPEVWTTGEVHSYKFTATAADNNAAQGKTATQTFTWDASPLTAYSQAILSDDAVGYWKLDEAAGTTATNTIGAPNGTYTNGPTINQTTGVQDAGTAVTFDGTNDYVTAPFNAALNPTQFSVEAWVRVSGGTGTYRCAASSWDVPGRRGYWLGATTGNNWALFYGTGTASSTLNGSAVVLDTWTHLVGTYDGTTYRLYINGSLANSVVDTLSRVVATTPFLIGAGDAGPSNFMNGRIDEVAVYNSALPAQRVTEHYNAGKL